MEIIFKVDYRAVVNPIPADFNCSSPEGGGNLTSWSACENRIFAVEAALRVLAQSGGKAHAAVSGLVQELIAEFRCRQEGEIAATKRAGAVALQCARALDSMEKRLAAAASPAEAIALSQELEVELQRLRIAAYDHLSTALNRESSRERRKFPLVFRN